MKRLKMEISDQSDMSESQTDAFIIPACYKKTDLLLN